MKNIKKIIIPFLLLLSSHVSAATISWNLTTTNINVDDVFTVNIVGTGFVNNVDGGGVNISYDSSILNVLSVSVDDIIWDLGYNSTGTIDNLAGTVDGIMVNAWSNVTGDFMVASIQMQAIGAGNSFLSVNEYSLNPWASGGSLINPVFEDSSVSVGAIPVPAAVWLFGSGLIALVGMARKKN